MKFRAGSIRAASPSASLSRSNSVVLPEPGSPSSTYAGTSLKALSGLDSVASFRSSAWHDLGAGAVN